MSPNSRSQALTAFDVEPALIRRVSSFLGYVVGGILRVGNAAFTAPKLALSRNGADLSKDDLTDRLMRKLQNEIRAMDQERDRFIDLITYAERSALVVLGVTVTVLAGFLSQIWGSGGVAFRTELAELLQRSGQLFTLAFILPVFRYLAHDNFMRSRWRALVYLVVWILGLLVIYIRFTVLFQEIGETILRYAKIALP